MYLTVFQAFGQIPGNGRLSIFQPVKQLPVNHVPKLSAGRIGQQQFFLDGPLQHPLHCQSRLIQISMLMQIRIKFLQLLGILDQFFDRQTLRGHFRKKLDFFQVRCALESDMECVAVQIIEFVGAQITVGYPACQRMISL